MGMSMDLKKNANGNGKDDYGVKADGYFPMESQGSKTGVCDWMEMWDYVGGIQFRGFMAQKEDEKAMFVFFNQAVLDGDLKAG
jgi:hypothetical protein